MQISFSPEIINRDRLIQASNAFNQGEFQQSRILLNEILKDTPHNIEATQLLGLVMAKLGVYDVSLGMLTKVVKSNPDDPIALSNLGTTLNMTGKFSDAVPFFEKAISLNPDFVEAHTNLGIAYKRLDNLSPAFNAFEKALSLKPGLIQALEEIPSICYTLGYHDKALEYTKRLYEITRLPQLKITMAILIPQVMRSREEIIKVREEYEDNLNRLMKENLRMDKSYASVISSTFYLAYHGLNNKTLQIKLAKLFEKIDPSLIYESPNLRNRKSPEGKIKIGFISKYMSKAHPIYIHFSKIISGLANNDDLEIHLIHSRKDNNSLDEEVRKTFAKCHMAGFTENIYDARSTIEKLDLDILVYTDIGMDQFTYFLAFSRLAPIQCAMGGHPDTTGISNMDYYISSYPCEPENPEDHYSEKLLRVNHLPVYIEKPDLSILEKGHRVIARNGNQNIYTCPMLMQKLHPDFDDAISQILSSDKDGVVIFFKGKGDWHDQVAERMRKDFAPEIFRRIIFAPYAQKNDFLMMLDQSDVILDSFYFGGGTTHFQAFAVGTPVVTWPGEFMRGRVALACYKMMGIEGLIASSPEEYVNIAVTLGKNKELRNKLKSEILSRNHVLYENPAPVPELTELFRRLAYHSDNKADSVTN